MSCDPRKCWLKSSHVTGALLRCRFGNVRSPGRIQSSRPVSIKQCSWPVATQQLAHFNHCIAQRLLRVARANADNCELKLNSPNHRVRTRMHSGVTEKASDGLPMSIFTAIEVHDQLRKNS